MRITMDSRALPTTLPSKLTLEPISLQNSLTLLWNTSNSELNWTLQSKLTHVYKNSILATLGVQPTFSFEINYTYCIIINNEYSYIHVHVYDPHDWEWNQNLVTSCHISTPKKNARNLSLPPSLSPLLCAHTHTHTHTHSSSYRHVYTTTLNRPGGDNPCKTTSTIHRKFKKNKYEIQGGRVMLPHRGNPISSSSSQICTGWASVLVTLQEFKYSSIRWLLIAARPHST